jgi:hypothetical protein
MTQVDDLSRSFVAFDQTASLTVVVEMSQSSWLVAGMVPGVVRQPLKKLEPDPDALQRLLERWRAEAVKTGQTIERIVLAYEAGLFRYWRLESSPEGTLRWCREAAILQEQLTHFRSSLMTNRCATYQRFCNFGSSQPCRMTGIRSATPEPGPTASYQSRLLCTAPQFQHVRSSVRYDRNSTAKSPVGYARAPRASGATRSFSGC